MPACTYQIPKFQYCRDRGSLNLHSAHCARLRQTYRRRIAILEPARTVIYIHPRVSWSDEACKHVKETTGSALTKLHIDRVEPGRVQGSSEDCIRIHALRGSRHVISARGIETGVSRERLQQGLDMRRWTVVRVDHHMYSNAIRSSDRDTTHTRVKFRPKILRTATRLLFAPAARDCIRCTKVA